MQTLTLSSLCHSGFFLDKPRGQFVRLGFGRLLNHTPCNRSRVTCRASLCGACNCRTRVGSCVSSRRCHSDFKSFIIPDCHNRLARQGRGAIKFAHFFRLCQNCNADSHARDNNIHTGLISRITQGSTSPIKDNDANTTVVKLTKNSQNGLCQIQISRTTITNNPQIHHAGARFLIPCRRLSRQLRRVGHAKNQIAQISRI